MPTKQKLGEILLEAGSINDSQLRAGLAYQRQWGIQLGEALITLGFVTEVNILKVLSQQLQIPAVNLANTNISRDTLALIKPEFAEKHEIIPLGKRMVKGKEILLVATADPTNLALLDEIRFLVNIPSKFAITTRSSIKKAIKKFYYHETVNFSEGVDNRILKMNPDDLVVLKADGMEGEDIAYSEKFEHRQASSPVDTVVPSTSDRSNKPTVSKEFQALLKLLIKKGLISRNEFIDELKKL